MRQGKVYLVGAGPGAWDLVSVRAARVLAEADVLLCDQLVPDAVLSWVRRGEWSAWGGARAIRCQIRGRLPNGW
jgi:uroporphyrin-III C-methyltransferase